MADKFPGKMTEEQQINAAFEFDAMRRRAESAESQRDHARRMVDGATQVLDVLGACSQPRKPECEGNATIRYYARISRDRAKCEACLRDYLDKLAKEEEKHA